MSVYMCNDRMDLVGNVQKTGILLCEYGYKRIGQGGVWSFAKRFFWYCLFN